jgi:hypothetical protein
MSNPEINFNNINSFGYFLLNSTMIRQHLPNNKADIIDSAFGKYVLFKEIENRYNITLGMFKPHKSPKGKSFICVKDLRDNIFYLNNKAIECIQSLFDENQIENNGLPNQELPKPYHLKSNDIISITDYINKSSGNTTISELSNEKPKKDYNGGFLANVLGISEISWISKSINIKPINDFFDSLTFDFKDIYIVSSEGETISYYENPPILKLNGNIIRIKNNVVVALNNTFQFESDYNSYIYLPKDILSQNLTPVKYFFPRRNHFATYSKAKEWVKRQQYNDFTERQERLNKKLLNISKNIDSLERNREAYIKDTIEKYDKNISSQKGKYDKFSRELKELTVNFDKQRDEEVI